MENESPVRIEVCPCPTCNGEGNRRRPNPDDLQRLRRSYNLSLAEMAKIAKKPDGGTVTLSFLHSVERGYPCPGWLLDAYLALPSLGIQGVESRRKLAGAERREYLAGRKREKYARAMEQAKGRPRRRMATCPYCDRRIAVRRDGTLAEHPPVRFTPISDDNRCAGSHTPRPQ